MSVVERADDITVSVHLKSMSCYSCGVAFGMSEGFFADRLRDHKNFYCPNGHDQHFIGETEAEKYKRYYDAVVERANELRMERDRKDRQLSAARGRVTRIKNRVANGVCPCCNRTFANLARHMKGQHPDFAGQEVGA